MNKLSAKQMELASEEEKVSIVDFNTVETFTAEDLDKIVREARIAQAEQIVKMAKAAFEFVGKAIANIQNGISVATAYDELSRLSDRELADIGIQREEIGRVAFDDVTNRAAQADLAVYGYNVKTGRPTNDWVDHIAA